VAVLCCFSSYCVCCWRWLDDTHHPSTCSTSTDCLTPKPALRALSHATHRQASSQVHLRHLSWRSQYLSTQSRSASSCGWPALRRPPELLWPSLGGAGRRWLDCFDSTARTPKLRASASRSHSSSAPCPRGHWCSWKCSLRCSRLRLPPPKAEQACPSSETDSDYYSARARSRPGQRYPESHDP